jgi:hypothetical protein
MSGLGVARLTTEAPLEDAPSAKGLSAGIYEEMDQTEEGDFVGDFDFAAWRAENVNENSNGVNFGMVWIDVEINPSSGCSWTSYSWSSNCDYLNSLISAVKSHGKAVGVYTSQYEWESTMGSLGACTSAASVPLWYAHYDNWASFGDYVKIGGWNSPAMKQFVGDTTLCGIGIDETCY